MHDHLIPQFDGTLFRVAIKQQVKPYIFDAGKANQVRNLLKDKRRRRLEQLSKNASKASATPSADSIEASDLFEGVFDNTFQDPDTLMLEISAFCALHYGTQISFPSGQAPSVTLAAVLIKAELSYDDLAFSDTDSDPNRLETIFHFHERRYAYPLARNPPGSI
jgi:hypothetical protein